MKKVLFFTIIFFLVFVGSAQESIENLNRKVDEYVFSISERYGIPGAAVAIIKDGKTLHESYYGKASLEHNVPISKNSIFRVYSLTKTIVVTAFFQLVEQNQLSVEDKVSDYLNDIPQAWGGIKLKYLLSHSSGLPDMAPIMEFEDLSEEEAKQKVFKQELSFKVGERYDYNQTNFWLIQRIIEKVTGQDIQRFILENQFNDDSDSTVFLSSDSRDIVLNRVTPYFPFRNGKLIIDTSYLQGKYMWSANGLNLNLDDYIKWNKEFENNDLLSEDMKNKMFEPFKYSNDKKLFASGWDVHNLNGHVSYGFSGSLVTAYRVFPTDDMSIIFLSNGLEHYYNIENIINHLASLVNNDIRDAEYLLYEKLMKSAIEQTFDSFFEEYQVDKNNIENSKIDFEGHLNSIGYELLRMDKTDRALKIFELNTKEHPESWNVWDSLAEGFEKSGNPQKAITNYEKSLKLNSDNKHATERLKELQKI